MFADRWEWPLREYWIDIAWAAFSIVNLFAMILIPEWETVPFHFVWVSLTLVYGFRVWRTRPTVWVLAVVMLATGVAIGADVVRGAQPVDELTEVPLMAAMFVVMVWHARRRLAAMSELERFSQNNLDLLQREQRFVQDASHELRTPITVALGHAELIQRSSADPAISDDVRVVVDELLRLRRLADRLLLLAASEDQHFLRMTTVRASSVIDDALHRWRPSPRRWLLAEATDVAVQADTDRLALALDALIENAVRHTAAGQTIELGARLHGTDVVFWVRDSGTGIPQADLPTVFDRFRRADRDRNRDTGGLGLGLSIVKAIAEAHGGNVRARNARGGGSVFEILLPAGSPAAEAPTAADDVPVTRRAPESELERQQASLRAGERTS
jgi:signal transduction histidine kinase